MWRRAAGRMAGLAMPKIVVLAVLAAEPATALDLVGVTSATLAWTPATGPVAGYSVFVSRNGSVPAAPERKVTGTRVTVAGVLGDTLVVWVAAYDAGGRQGPVSPSSVPLRFTASPPPPPEPLPPGDLDGDGRSELFLWNRPTGQLSALGNVLGPQLTGGTVPSGHPSDWQLSVTGDYDGDGRSDLLWRSRSTGLALVCQMDGISPGACGFPFTAAGERELLGAADVTGDGRAEVLLREPHTGAVTGCFLTSVSFGLCVPVAQTSPDSRVLLGGDHDGDGRADLLVQDPATWQVRICGVLGPAAAACTTPSSLPGGEIVASADYDADGAADLLWRTPSSGQLWLSFPRRGGFDAFRWLGLAPIGAEIDGSPDLDGDGRAEVVIRDPGTGSIAVWQVDENGLVRKISLGLLGIDVLLGGSREAR